VGQYFLACLRENRPLVSTVCEEFLQKWEPTEQGPQDQDAAIAVLYTGRMDNGVKQEPYRIDQDVALLALDFLARIVA